MSSVRKMTMWGGAGLVFIAAGCAAPKVDFATVERPARAAELGAFDVFAGSWKWEARVVNAADPGDEWTGTATWEWTLDKRCLRGQMAVRSTHAEFETAGIWSWNPKRRKYIWWMFNNWGYPQQGSATYNACTKVWTMNYKSVGLDGSRSYGRYRLTIADEDTIDWHMVEWADPLHLIRKIEMTGAYTRIK